MIERTGSGSIGIDAAERLPWGYWDVIDYLFATSEDLGAALRRFERYFAIVSTGVAHELEPHGDTVHLVGATPPAVRRGSWLRSSSPSPPSSVTPGWRSESRWCPRAVHFAAPAPSSDAAQRLFFGCPV
ncbi:MAG: AraC family transcriptional regulator, partial [Sandaracinaceae bacterium]|nr:AraC family transcriptional regulator [Sandaracinaceae bacterium]